MFMWCCQRRDPQHGKSAVDADDRARRRLMRGPAASPACATPAAPVGLEGSHRQMAAGPRLFIPAARSVPRGHSDGRRRTDFGSRCQCCNALSFSMGIADGVTEPPRGAGRCQGCDQVKIMMSGGVASPTIRSTACSSRWRVEAAVRRRTPLAAMSVRTPIRRRR